METWDALRARRNVRMFAPDPVADEDLDRIVEAGRRAPSGSNWQPWDFVVVTDRDQLQRLAGVWQGASHIARSAATIGIVAPTVDDPGRAGILQFDLGQATMMMMIAAADLGIGSGHAAVRDQELARQLLGYPEDRFCAHLIPLGYPADRPLRPLRNPDRRPFDDLVHVGRF